MTERHDTDPLSEAPLLRSIPRTDPFVVPDGFFDRFPMQVQAAINSRHSGWKAILNHFRGAHPAWRITAAVCGLALAVLVVRTALVGGHAAGEHEAASVELTADDLLALEVNEEDLLAASALEDWETDWSGTLTAEELNLYLEHEDLELELIIETL